MIQMLAAGLVAIISTLGGAYAATRWPLHGGLKPDQAEAVAAELVKLEPVSVPIIRSGKVQGYVVARAVVSASAADVKRSRPALIAFATEALFRTIYDEQTIDFAALKPMQLAAIARRVVELANERIGQPAVRQTVIESLNFVSQAEVREQLGR